MQLSHAQKRALVDDGYVVLPGVVPRVMVDEALRAINHRIGEGIDPAEVAKYRVQTFCPDLVGAPPITDLVARTPAFELAESLIGRGRLKPITGAQIALRFPAKPGEGAPAKRFGPHVDGIPDRNLSNGVPKGTILNFTALACVLLSELSGPDAGNFTVWPGSHTAHATWLRQHGVRRLLEQMPDVQRREPVQITGKPGDVVLAHYLLGHSVGPNLSPHVRYACFFRLEVNDLAAHREESIVAPWRDWPGLAEFVDERERVAS